MDEWMDGWMDGWMDAWMDAWMDLHIFFQSQHLRDGSDAEIITNK